MRGEIDSSTGAWRCIYCHSPSFFRARQKTALQCLLWQIGIIAMQDSIRWNVIYRCDRKKTTCPGVWQRIGIVTLRLTSKRSDGAITLGIIFTGSVINSSNYRGVIRLTKAALTILWYAANCTWVIWVEVFERSVDLGCHSPLLSRWLTCIF